MTKLDVFVNQLKIEFDIGVKSKASTEANLYHSRIYRANKKGDLDLVLKLVKEARQPTNLSDPCFKKLSYIRYAYD